MHPKFNLDATETYLKKRDFTVFICLAFDELVQVCGENDPEFIFIPWDHPDPGQARTIHKTLYQACTGTIVPFINQPARDQLWQLESSGFEFKGFPPFSGVTVQRIIARIENKNQLLAKAMSKAQAKDTKKNTSGSFQVKSQFKDDSPLGANQRSEAILLDEPTDNSTIRVQSGRVQKDSLSPEQIKNKKRKLTQFSDAENPSENFIFVPKQEKKLSQKQKDRLQQKFSESVQNEFGELVKAYDDIENTHQKKLLTTRHIYVLAVQQPEWTGYLTLASESFIEPNSALGILSDWVKSVKEQTSTKDTQTADIEITNEESEVFFDMLIKPIDYAHFSSFKAEYQQEISHNNKRTLIAFFPFSPYHVMSTFHDNEDILEVPLEFLRGQTMLTFDLMLHLPENKKYITYVRAMDTLENEKLERLKKKFVETCYTKPEFEEELTRYKAETNLLSLFESYANMIKN